MSKKLHHYVIFDCETGGTDKENLHAIKHPITEIACIGLDSDLNEIGRYQSYVKGRYANKKYVGYSTIHDQTYSDEALRVTGITIEKLESLGKEAKIVCNDLFKFFETCKSSHRYHKIILVGHNVVYDIPFLSYLFKLYNKDLGKYVQGYYDHVGNFQPVYYDTQFWARSKQIEEGIANSLTDVALREGIELVDAHSAMNDTIATMEIFKRDILRLRNTGLNNEIVQTTKFRDSFMFEY